VLAICLIVVPLGGSLTAAWQLKLLDPTETEQRMKELVSAVDDDRTGTLRLQE
jgi:hypothetical protein